LRQNVRVPSPDSLRAGVPSLREGDPRAIGGYHLRGRIGSGGQGVVYLGSDGQGHDVAVKVLKVIDDAKTQDRFLKEVAAFMAPEQVAGGHVTSAADMWAWAVCVVFAGTGTLPFGGASQPFEAVLAAILYRKPVVGPLPEPLASLVLKCLDRDPTQRPTAQEVAAALVCGAAPRADAPPVPVPPGTGVSVPAHPASSPLDSTIPPRPQRRTGTGRGRISPRLGLIAVALVLAAAAVLIPAILKSAGNPPARSPAHHAAVLPTAARLPPPGTRLPRTHTVLLLRPSDPVRILSYQPYRSTEKYVLNPASGRYDLAGRAAPGRYGLMSWGVIVSPDGWHEAIFDKKNITFVNLRTGQRRSTPGYPAYQGHVPSFDPGTILAANPQFSPNGRYLLAMDDAYIIIINTDTLKFATFKPARIFFTGGAWWTSGSARIVLQDSPDTAAVYDLGGKLQLRLPMGRNSAPIDSAFGLFLYTCPTAGSRDLLFGCVRDVSTGKLVARVPVPWSHGLTSVYSVSTTKITSTAGPAAGWWSVTSRGVSRAHSPSHARPTSRIRPRSSSRTYPLPPRSRGWCGCPRMGHSSQEPMPPSCLNPATR
jgi:hypothetical protein